MSCFDMCPTVYLSENEVPVKVGFLFRECVVIKRHDINECDVTIYNHVDMVLFCHFSHDLFQSSLCGVNCH